MPNLIPPANTLRSRTENLIRALDVRLPPVARSTLADDIGCLIAIASLGAAAYLMLVLA